MRPDMSKVATERSRDSVLGRTKGSCRRLHDLEKLDLLPVKEGMRPTRQGQLREPSFVHVAPLRRFLESRVGKPWDKVYAEFRAVVQPTSLSRSEVLDRFVGLVAVNVRIEGGTLVQHSQRGPNVHSVRRFYVCPKTGILHKLKAKGRSQPRYEPTEAVWADWSNPDSPSEYRKLDGIWYLVAFATWCGSGLFPRWDVIEKAMVHHGGWQITIDGRSRTYYADTKRQLGSREIERLGLNEMRRRVG